MNIAGTMRDLSGLLFWLSISLTIWNMFLNIIWKSLFIISKLILSAGLRKYMALHRIYQAWYSQYRPARFPWPCFCQYRILVERDQWHLRSTPESSDLERGQNRWTSFRCRNCGQRARLSHHMYMTVLNILNLVANFPKLLQAVGFNIVGNLWVGHCSSQQMFLPQLALRKVKPQIPLDKKTIAIGDVLGVPMDDKGMSLWKDEASKWKAADDCWYVLVQGIHVNKHAIAVL